MSFDTFENEKTVITRSEEVAGTLAGSEAGERYIELLHQYKKLFTTTSRLVKMSDRNEKRLKEANSKINSQQRLLEQAHKKLSDHARLLEDKVLQRTRELTVAQTKLEKLVQLGIGLSRERDYDRFLDMILQGEQELANADGGILFSMADDRAAIELVRIDSLDLHLDRTAEQDAAEKSIPLRDPDGRPRYFDPIAHSVLTERTVNVPSIADCRDYDFSHIRELDSRLGYQSHSFLAVPLKPRNGEIIGVLVLLNARIRGTGRFTAFDPDDERFIEALASQAAVTMDNKQLIRAQSDLFDSVIQVLAGAIDAKSPYTGGHCARVPELGAMLAKAACDCEEGPLATFNLGEHEWREFHLAGWLHDCGKITTPEYVVDKATKLETIYNRIHEVRMRFEVLLRDARIACLETIAAGGDQQREEQRYHDTARELQEEFAFIAECNIGGEFMGEDKIARLQAIADRTWLRYFDDRLGLSHIELERYRPMTATTLPVAEPLLADRPEQIIRRPGEMALPYDMEKLGITLKVPANLNNLGELHNLRISRGTLNDEERFKINEHIIHTIVMLDRLPFPKELVRVPLIAGSHHETLLGSGYPRSINMEEMPVQARIMALADIFEALTASDRPYKKAKSLSEALRILSFFRDDRHIDPEIFALFLTSGVYLEYAEKFLAPEQIDEVDIEKLLLKPETATVA